MRHWRTNKLWIVHPQFMGGITSSVICNIWRCYCLGPQTLFWLCFLICFVNVTIRIRGNLTVNKVDDPRPIVPIARWHSWRADPRGVHVHPVHNPVLPHLVSSSHLIHAFMPRHPELFEVVTVQNLRGVHPDVGTSVCIVVSTISYWGLLIKNRHKLILIIIIAMTLVAMVMILT